MAAQVIIELEYGVSHTHTHTRTQKHLAITLLKQKIQHMCDIIWTGFRQGVGVGAGMGARGCSQRNIMLLTILAFSPFTYILIISQDGFCVDYKNTHTHVCIQRGYDMCGRGL